MEPRIQYATAGDGVGIAFWTLGTGRPFLQMPLIPFSHLQLEWQFAPYRYWYECLAERRMLVRYDCRDAGLSERGVANYSLEALLLDLEAVRQQLGLEQFDLLGAHNAGPVAIAYAARYPQYVRRLVLWCTFARAADYYHWPAVQAGMNLIDADWELYTETTARSLALGWTEGELARQVAAYLRSSMTWPAAQRALRVIAGFDVTECLPQVRAPTLLFHRREFASIELSVARALVSAIPQGRLALLEGASLVPLGESMNEVLQGIDDFLDDGTARGPATRRGRAEHDAPVTILFTDVAESTALTQRLGDTRARELLRVHERIVRDALALHGGREVKTMGDGFMASFGSATRALECAIAVQKALAAHNRSAPEPLRVRIGLSAGEPIAEDTDYFGTTVQLAARLCAQAAPGEIAVANVVRELTAGKGFVFTSRGDAQLRGFAEPLPLYALRWNDSEE